MTSLSPLVAGLRQTLEERLDEQIPEGATVALLDFPTHTNVGDFAIWLGELAYLRRRRCRIAYTSTLETYAPDRLRHLAPEGPILLHGGGNVGDLWPSHQELRERVLTDFPNRTVIQLPQSVYFSSQNAARRAISAMGSHSKFYLFVRDRQSAARVQDLNRVVLCPDMAFALDVPQDNRPLSDSVLCLLRTDHEAGEPRGEVLKSATLVDWVQRRQGRHEQRWRSALRLAARTRRHKRLARPAQWAARRSFETLAREELQLGITLLAGARAVVTDRLHGHILSELLGLQHAVVDNRNGKVFSFIDTWTGDSIFCHRARSIPEAFDLVQERPT